MCTSKSVAPRQTLCKGHVQGLYEAQISISFPLSLSQMTTNMVAHHNTDLFSDTSGGLKSEVSFTGLKSRCCRLGSFWKPEREKVSCLFYLPEASYLPWLMALSLSHSKLLFPPSHLLLLFCQKSVAVSLPGERYGLGVTISLPSLPLWGEVCDGSWAVFLLCEGDEPRLEMKPMTLPLFASDVNRPELDSLAVQVSSGTKVLRKEIRKWRNPFLKPRAVLYMTLSLTG